MGGNCYPFARVHLVLLSIDGNTKQIRITFILFAELTPCTLPPHPCNNNGNCTANEEDESVECHCFEGWEGENCQIGEFDISYGVL